MDAVEEAIQILETVGGGQRQSGRTRAMLDSIKPELPKTVIMVHDQPSAEYIKRLLQDFYPQLLPFVEISTIASVDRLHGVQRLKVDHAVVQFCGGRPEYLHLREFARVIALREQP